MGESVNDDFHVTCPQRRRIEHHDEQNQEIWASEEWKEAETLFLQENPTCCVCGGRSEVHHHPDLEVYGTPEYLNLSGTLPYCNICHDGEHKGKFKCPVCGRLRSKREGERCYACLEPGDRERIQQEKRTRIAGKNQYDRKRYRQYHPKKVIDKSTGKWVVLRGGKKRIP